MNFKKIIKALLYPHIGVRIALIPISAFLLLASMLLFGTKSFYAIVSYVIAAYTLTVWCVKIPDLISLCKGFGNKNKYAKRWITDTRLRVNVSLSGTLLWNCAYAVFQLSLGIVHGSFWFYSLAGYSMCLAVMRFFLLRYSAGNKPGDKMCAEYVRYRACGIVLLVLNLALLTIVFFMVHWNRTFVHREITTIALAVHSFTSLVFAIINTAKYRKYNSPVCSASKVVSLASACVSLLTTESTMLNTFGQNTVDDMTRKILLGSSGVAVSLFIIIMAVYMIAHGTVKIKMLNKTKE